MLGAAVGTWVLGLRPAPAALCLGNPKTKRCRPEMIFFQEETLTPGSGGFRNRPGGVLWGGEWGERGMGLLSRGMGCAPSLSLLAVGSAKSSASPARGEWGLRAGSRGAHPHPLPTSCPQTVMGRAGGRCEGRAGIHLQGGDSREAARTVLCK